MRSKNGSNYELDDLSSEYGEVTRKTRKGAPLRAKGGPKATLGVETEDESHLLSDGANQRGDARKPVPAVDVFHLNAPPLHLPALDDYLSKLTTPKFSPFLTSKSAKTGQGMFPPMDKLAETGKALQDLEYNSVVAPGWRDRNSVLGGLTNLAIGITGSSFVSSFYSLQGILDTVQIFALLLSTLVPKSGDSDAIRWKQVLLGTIPNVLALNFGTTLIQSLVLLFLFMALVSVLLFSFWRISDRFKPLGLQEGLVPYSEPGSGWSFILISFVITVLYLPISTIATHALVWSDDFWAVPNPYVNATTFPPSLPQLGPPNEFRDPLDFCYTTTMKRNEVNLAPYVLVASGLIFVFLTVWFPLKLRQIIAQSLPEVDRFTEMGKHRSRNEMDREYQRLLARDRQPLNFLYEDFRRDWGTYKSFYLFAKFSALIIIAVINPDNCLFRSLTRSYVSIARQSLLLSLFSLLFLLQCIWAPFIDQVSNASEWVSRINYLLTALVGLGVALNVPGKDALNGPILYIIYIVTYGLSGYFTLINFSWMHRIVKRMFGRLDFSIDIFSPRIDLSPTSAHLKRRIWQETISALFLTSPLTRIPKDQRMVFAICKNFEFPPYLLGFRGTPAERHVENLKILREVGLKGYEDGLRFIRECDLQEFRFIEKSIQNYFVGPDCYWKESRSDVTRAPGVSHFGTAWWIPFPPSLVLRYDSGSVIVLRSLQGFRQYLSQNQAPEVTRKRQIRLALRALDKRPVHWPYEHHETIGGHRICCCGKRYHAKTVTNFRSALFAIGRQGCLSWAGYDFGSGFNVELSYSKSVIVNGDIIGLDDDWQLTPQLARFLALNSTQISQRLPIVEQAISDYRKHCAQECYAKNDVLSYQFLMYAYNTVQNQGELVKNVVKEEKDLRVRDLIVTNEFALRAAHERYEAASVSEATAWWYIFWDDLWRRNSSAITAMTLHAQDFDPRYPTSIAYTPLPRAALENVLAQRGLYTSKAKWNAFFHSGVLNKLYFRLNDAVFKESPNAIVCHLGEDASHFVLDDIDKGSHARTSSLGTGGGTDHDDSSILPRPEYQWEGILEDPLLPSKGKQYRAGWTAKLEVWLGISPLWRAGKVSKGLALDVTLANGKYELFK